jgi:hypothetical protein
LAQTPSYHSFLTAPFYHSSSCTSPTVSFKVSPVLSL